MTLDLAEYILEKKWDDVQYNRNCKDAFLGSKKWLLSLMSVETVERKIVEDICHSIEFASTKPSIVEAGESLFSAWHFVMFWPYITTKDTIQQIEVSRSREWLTIVSYNNTFDSIPERNYSIFQFLINTIFERKRMCDISFQGGWERIRI